MISIPLLFMWVRDPVGFTIRGTVITEEREGRRPNIHIDAIDWLDEFPEVGELIAEQNMTATYSVTAETITENYKAYLTLHIHFEDDGQGIYFKMWLAGGGLKNDPYL